MASEGQPPGLEPVNLADVRCSFCGLPGTETRLIAGPTPEVAICSACVALCTEILAEEGEEAPARSPNRDG